MHDNSNLLHKARLGRMTALGAEDDVADDHDAFAKLRNADQGTLSSGPSIRSGALFASRDRQGFLGNFAARARQRHFPEAAE